MVAESKSCAARCVCHIFNEVLAENAALVFALFEILVFIWLFLIAEVIQSFSPCLRT